MAEMNLLEMDAVAALLELGGFRAFNQNQDNENSPPVNLIVNVPEAKATPKSPELAKDPGPRSSEIVQVSYDLLVRKNSNSNKNVKRRTKHSINEEYRRSNTTSAIRNKHWKKPQINGSSYCRWQSSRTYEVDKNGMAKIGDGHTTVPARLLKQLEGTYFTNAVRKLLTSVFSRRVLATHSLTGKQSPAFPNKTAKAKLDPASVRDIIQTVCENCNVEENLVRISITTKCADESKMLRSRESRLSKKENRRPRLQSSSEDSSG